MLVSGEVPQTRSFKRFWLGLRERFTLHTDIAYRREGLTDWPVYQAVISILIATGKTDRVEQTADSSRLRDFPVERGAIARDRAKKTDVAQIDLLLPIDLYCCLWLRKKRERIESGHDRLRQKGRVVVDQEEPLTKQRIQIEISVCALIPIQRQRKEIHPLP